MNILVNYDDLFSEFQKIVKKQMKSYKIGFNNLFSKFKNVEILILKLFFIFPKIVVFNGRILSKSVIFFIKKIAFLTTKLFLFILKTPYESLFDELLFLFDQFLIFERKRSKLTKMW